MKLFHEKHRIIVSLFPLSTRSRNMRKVEGKGRRPASWLKEPPEDFLILWPQNLNGKASLLSFETASYRDYGGADFLKEVLEQTLESDTLPSSPDS